MRHKRIYRVYREAGLGLKRKKRKHCVREGRPLRACTAPNQEWGLDFVHDVLAAETIHSIAKQRKPAITRSPDDPIPRCFHGILAETLYTLPVPAPLRTEPDLVCWKLLLFTKKRVDFAAMRTP